MDNQQNCSLAMYNVCYSIVANIKPDSYWHLHEGEQGALKCVLYLTFTRKFVYEWLNSDYFINE